MKKPLRVVAMYLPQFHPTAENDKWWEPGFTEWTNVTRARPLFRGHRQPNLPTELGLYDLRVPEIREQQAALASEYGVTAFCYYHYWFGGGRRILERPFDEVLRSGAPKFPFMLCWANQSWSGIWHGLSGRILAEQTYPGPRDEVEHFAALLPAFRDPRYLLEDGKPIFMVYAPMELPDAPAFTQHLRTLAAAAGLKGLYLIAEHSDPFWDAKRFGFDAFVLKPSFMRRRTWTPWSTPWKKIRNKILDICKIPSKFDYRKVMPYYLPMRAADEAIPCVLPNWDNTPRSGARGVVMLNATPESFGCALDRAYARHSQRRSESSLFFIKSWNEWGEGNHLEPNVQYGREYLKVLKSRLDTWLGVK